jgi:hypothetical protein
MGYMIGFQPVMDNYQIHGHCQESPNLLKNLGSLPNQEAGRRDLFLNIQATTTFENHFNPRLLSLLPPEDAFYLKNLICVLSAEWEKTVWGASGHPGHISCGLNGTKSRPTFCLGDNLRKYNINHFHGSRAPSGQGALVGYWDINGSRTKIEKIGE